MSAVIIYDILDKSRTFEDKEEQKVEDILELPGRAPRRVVQLLTHRRHC